MTDFLVDLSWGKGVEESGSPGVGELNIQLS